MHASVLVFSSFLIHTVDYLPVYLRQHPVKLDYVLRFQGIILVDCVIILGTVLLAMDMQGSEPGKILEVRLATFRATRTFLK